MPMLSRHSASWSHTIGAYKCIFYSNDSRSLKYAYDGRVFPHRVKYGPLLFGCSCRDCHRSLVCTDSLAVSMFFDPTLQVPDDDRAGRVQARVQKKRLTNPFSAEKERRKSEKEKKEETDKPDKPRWDPVIEREVDVVDDSFAATAAKTRRKLIVSPPPPVLHQHHSDGEVSRPMPPRGRGSTRGRAATRCRRTSTPCASRHPVDTFRDLVAAREEDVLAARLLSPRRARHNPCRSGSWRLFKTRDLIAPARKTTRRRRRRSELR